MIEDFMSLLRPDDDVLWPIATDVVEKVIATKCHFRPSYKSKACIHTWLAWQEEPGKPLGQAITKGFVNSDAPIGHILITWFRRLFELDSAS